MFVRGKQGPVDPSPEIPAAFFLLGAGVLVPGKWTAFAGLRVGEGPRASFHHDSHVSSPFAEDLAQVRP